MGEITDNIHEALDFYKIKKGKKPTYIKMSIQLKDPLIKELSEMANIEGEKVKISDISSVFGTQIEFSVLLPKEIMELK